MNPSKLLEPVQGKNISGVEMTAASGLTISTDLLDRPLRQQAISTSEEIKRLALS
jgi:hypothetical protein